MAQEFKKICDMLEAAESVLLITHVNPDGDALGSTGALYHSAILAGKKASLMLHDVPSEQYVPLLETVTTHLPDEFAAAAESADVIVIADTGSNVQLGTLAEKLLPFREKTVVIDHHATFDDIAAVRWTDTSAAAAGVMILEIIEILEWPMNETIANLLARAILTDTGWLRFSNTDGRCLRTMARLVDAGVRLDSLYRSIYQTDRPQKLRLLERTLASLELYADNQFAVMTLLRTDFEQTGARFDETENLVNEAMRIKTVEVAAIFIENTHNIRASLRSRDFINVAEIAKNFGGGGHARSSGMKVTNMTVDELKKQVVEKILENFQN
ncbi:MAG TPA: bifunctional oligoribonuclease/PAP phosphatase NrnA [Phycisphaerae bacterium]|mgnify:CR=1 FL=1|nr:bifunctional oligoribonuclease/PAP phosphatase NrnA [Phycisphaerae bacterium]HPS53193.1 bifunctional oligoribonuclease/PAP phosphatase NrnA [Phycisphaerae bacterium]